MGDNNLDKISQKEMLLRITKQVKKKRKVKKVKNPVLKVNVDSNANINSSEVENILYGINYGGKSSEKIREAVRQIED